MNHDIKLIHIDSALDDNERRKFTATIDNIHIESTVTFISLGRDVDAKDRWQYRINFPRHLNITKHKDYKSIRRELLGLMMQRTNQMAKEALR